MRALLAFIYLIFETHLFDIFENLTFLYKRCGKSRK